MNTLPPQWKWIETASPSTALPSRVPTEVISVLGHKSIDKLPRRANNAASVFWSVAEEPPRFNLLPRVMRLTSYRATMQPELAGFLTAAAAHLWLQELRVNGELTELVDEVGLLRGLYSLSVADNDLRTVPDAIGALERLEELDLSGNPIETLPEALGRLGALKNLSLGKSSYTPCPLVRLPASLAGLPGLSRLSFASMPALQIELQAFKHLTSLTLSGKVTPAGLPVELGKLTQLRSLKLCYSMLPEVPEAVRALRELKSLALTDGRFTALPDWLPELAQLESLVLSGSKSIDMKSLVAAADRMPQLKQLVLPLGVPPETRKALKTLGFKTGAANTSVMER